MNKAFTLIELLIVVTIIGILAAIAVPNFLNAQVRAKSARAMADIRMLRDQVRIFNMDTGLWLIDGNDGGSPDCTFKGRWFGVRPSAVGLSHVNTGENHFSGQIYMVLTTPVSYISSIPTDPFTQGVFYSYEDKDCSNNGGVYGVLAGAGPDGDNGDWHPSNRAVPYDGSNGLSSNGDLFYVWRFNQKLDNGYNTFFSGQQWFF